MEISIKKSFLGILFMITTTSILLLATKIKLTKTPPPITIWIHGTGPIGILPKPIAQYINRLGRKMLYCKKGLHRAISLPKNYHHHKIAHTLSIHAPDQFPLDWFYLFGWSGELDHTIRQQEAHNLFMQLKKVVTLYKNTYHCMPKIRIITHSHGGNIALNLAHIQGKASMPIIIDELILLACPVQHVTMDCIKHPMFKQIYALHSHFDTVQLLDPQGWPEYKKILEKAFKASSFNEALATIKQLEDKSLFSERHFPKHKNLIQARYQSKYRDIAHLEFISLPFMRKLPATLEQLRKYTHTNDIKQDEIIINLRA